jgi:N-acetylglucosaminyldiphosphoundecaprenol N-acetyl-beta-D-mannosaminyltransferase
LSFEDLFDLKFVSVDFDKFAQIIADLVPAKKKVTIFPVSVDVLIKSKRNAEFFFILKNASFLLPDGMPIIWASKLIGKKLKTKISGSDLFPALCKMAAENNYRVFFLGAKPGVAQKANEIIKRQYPQLNVVGVYSPPFGFEIVEEENQNIVKMVIEKKPDILFVGLGAPKQEKWIWKYKDEINVPVSIAVGASFDFVAGSVRRAPKWMQQIGLEWFFRLCQEPHRLWKRYLLGNIIFIWMVLKEFIKND